MACGTGERQMPSIRIIDLSESKAMNHMWLSHPVTGIYKMDYNKVLEYHIDKASGYHRCLQRHVQSRTDSRAALVWYEANDDGQNRRV